jgi:co-chaperonin GroES (HSP10)
MSKPPIELPVSRIKPLTNYVLVLLDPQKTVSDGGIELPEIAREPVREGYVIAVGPGLYRGTKTFVPMRLKRGDRVTVSGHGSRSIPEGEYVFELMRDPEIMLVHEASRS